jgi:hypothetical protein
MVMRAGGRPDSVVQNTGDKAFEGILVEMKGAPGTKTTAK